MSNTPPNKVESQVPRLDEAVGHAFTYSYAQPEEYRFCQDSVIFPMFVAEQLKNREIGHEFRALDIGSGCGVIGLELAHYVPNIQNFDFLEIQESFRSYFETNLRTVDELKLSFGLSMETTKTFALKALARPTISSSRIRPTSFRGKANSHLPS